MNCAKCRLSLLHCRCPDGLQQIMAVLEGPAAKSLANPVFNALVWRAAELFETRIEANQNEAFARWPWLDRRQYKPRRLWRKKH